MEKIANIYAAGKLRRIADSFTLNNLKQNQPLKLLTLPTNIIIKNIKVRFENLNEDYRFHFNFENKLNSPIQIAQNFKPIKSEFEDLRFILFNLASINDDINRMTQFESKICDLVLYPVKDIVNNCQIAVSIDYIAD